MNRATPTPGNRELVMRRQPIGSLSLAVMLATAVTPPGQSAAQSPTYDIVIAKGRVIDPESGLDAIRWVGINGNKIAAISSTPLTGRQVVDAQGLVVDPGFIDLHAHDQGTIVVRDEKLVDGVTPGRPVRRAIPRA